MTSYQKIEKALYSAKGETKENQYLLALCLAERFGVRHIDFWRGERLLIFSADKPEPCINIPSFLC